jgi:hypothetical protein
VRQVPVKVVKSKKKKLHLVDDTKVVEIRKSKKDYAKRYVKKYLQDGIEFIIIANTTDDLAKVYGTESPARTIYLLEKAKAMILNEIRSDDCDAS